MSDKSIDGLYKQLYGTPPTWSSDESVAALGSGDENTVIAGRSKLLALSIALTPAFTYMLILGFNAAIANLK